jgi:glycosyltransferase involved in cell wall biosynthesis
VLDEFEPELVHIHHLMHHSVGLAELAAQRGVPVVMTLHDYWLECPRFGQLLGWDDQICFDVDHARCSRCLNEFAWRNPRHLRWVARGLRFARRLTGLDLQAPLQRIWRRRSTHVDVGVAGPERKDPKPDPRIQDRMGERARMIQERLVPHVQRFLCPSDFLRERMLSAGLPAEKLETRLFGVPRPENWEAAPSPGRVRFAYVGSVLPHKGVDVLVEAFGLLTGRVDPDSVFLEIHGGWASNPSYGERVRDLAQDFGAEVTGAFDPSRIDEILSAVDALVVPSVWFENSPVTIHDARVRGIPVLCSDLGAMRELVPDEDRRFRAGDAQDLARALERFVLGDRAPRPAELPPTPREALEKLLQLYGGLCR